MSENIQNLVHDNVSNFKKVYIELTQECIKRRNSSGATQKDIAQMFGVDVRKIIELEKGNGGVGLWLRYCDLYDIEIKITYWYH